ncbi:sensor histidine kinase [Brachybacterium alimentarium]|uniref:sensor histidine kinase n=1 Tax=Brachybacterium alimentarium TaxID=47845 RepID=UPI003FD356A8
MGFALFLPLAYAIATRRPWWPWATLATAAIVLAPVIAGVSGRLDGERWLTDQVAAVLFLCAEVIVFLSLELGWVVFARMDAHRANENELAVTRERLRFANDLHDVQGHTLVAIKLKAELARRSLDRAPNTTRHELADIEALVADVSAQTRQIANVYRTVTLATELANVKQLLTTTGIVTTIDPVPTMLGDWEPLVATAVREGVSNILRHSAASTVSIRFAPDTVTISNDGVRAKRSTAADGGNGLVSLQTRFAEHGGSLDWRHHGDTFTVTARYAARGEAR